MFTRLRQAWTVLTGRIGLPDHLPNTIYVQSGQANNQFVQLLAWRDTIIALDAQGKIWELRPDFPLGGFVVQYLQDSPSPRYL